MSRKGSLRERFDRAWVPEPNTGCWLWTRYSNPCGYGRMNRGDGTGPTNANRIAWQLYRGEDPGSLHVLHRCDTPACVNPDHLFLGTHTDNLRDMRAKGRANPCGGNWPKGDAHYRAVLTADMVRRIRSSTERTIDLARSLGISWNAVAAARAGRTWKHVK